MGRVLEIPFGESSVTATLPDDTFIVPFSSGRRPDPIPDLGGAVAAALDHPLDAERIEARVKRGSTVTIAFDDPTVPSFGALRTLAIESILARLNQAGVRDEDITCVCANALHRKFRLEELGIILGYGLVERLGTRLRCHDAEDRKEIAYLGETTHGEPVELSTLVTGSDLTIYVNSASYRGFAGGWKSVCVGLSTFRTIRCHHTPDGMSMSVHDNPMHTMLNRMGEVVDSTLGDRIFKVDAIEAGPFETAHVYAGNTWSTRKAILGHLEEYYPPRREMSEARFDTIVYGVPDWSPYAIFSHTNPILTLLSSGLGYLGGTIQALGKPGCTVIMATPCPLRWNRVHHPSYEHVWKQVLAQTQDPYEIERVFTDYYATHEELIQLYRHHFAFHPVHGVFGTHPLKRLKHCGRVIVAGVGHPATAEHLGFEAASTVEEALAMAGALPGSGLQVAYAQHPAAPTKIAL
ncbi:MAG: DUF2088 domain-containing protein [Candidatus Hydrogenedentes bacterium]|nr:DUF2088 domain-containing protein [Candidatus Hydrogenedentota bacterium]